MKQRGFWQAVPRPVLALLGAGLAMCFAGFATLLNGGGRFGFWIFVTGWIVVVAGIVLGIRAAFALWCGNNASRGEE